MSGVNAEVFEEFLSQVDLTTYRLKYQPIKIVEMDLPRNIQALDAMYEVYWEKKELLHFEDFYEFYKSRHDQYIEEFREKTTMCSDCFHRGLPARIYRTWASIITQIHAGYVAEEVFGPSSVTMSTELDHAGIDFLVNYKNQIVNYQVKKITHSREVRVSKVSKSKNIEIDLIEYFVPPSAVFDNPYKKDGTPRAQYKQFTDNTTLKRLPNGFVVFTPQMFLPKKNELDRQ